MVAFFVAFLVGVHEGSGGLFFFVSDCLRRRFTLGGRDFDEVWSTDAGGTRLLWKFVPWRTRSGLWSLAGKWFVFLGKEDKGGASCVQEIE